MLLDHHKFEVEAEPAIFREYGAAPERISFTTDDGVAIAGWYFPAAEKKKAPTLIVLHTLGRTRADVLEFALPLWKKGLNLALIDMRGHGESGGRFFTYGYHEWRDVTGLVDWLEARPDGSADRVAVVGVSAGGAVAIAAAARDTRIKALVSFASFADLGEVIEHQHPWLPGFWRRRALRKAEKLAGFEVAETSPLSNIAEVKCPVLLVHGDADQYVPCADAGRLFERAPEPKELYSIPGADHANMFAKGGQELSDKISAFVKEHISRKKRR